MDSTQAGNCKAMEVDKHVKLSDSIHKLEDLVTSMDNLKCRIAGHDNDPERPGREYECLADAINSIPVDISECCDSINDSLAQIRQLLF